jgi:hypothetical protein
MIGVKVSKKVKNVWRKDMTLKFLQNYAFPPRKKQNNHEEWTFIHRFMHSLLGLYLQNVATAYPTVEFQHTPSN